MQLKYKFIAIGILVVLLTGALAMINGLVAERQALHVDVQHEIARSSSGEQTIVGPFLVAKYKKQVIEILSDGKSKRMATRYFYRNLLPQRYHFNGDLDTQYRSLGIYKALLYRAKNTISGEFVIPNQWLDTEEGELDKVMMVTAITDVRGIQSGLTMTLNEQEFELRPSTGLSQFGNGVHSLIDEQWLSKQKTVKFKVTLNLQGMQKLNIAPIGRETEVSLKANWPHPSFIGNFLPNKPTITDKGFSADWQTTFFSTNMLDKFVNCINRSSCGSVYESTLGVSLVDPVNQYLKTERAIKYAELFILLTLLAFMLYELFRKLSIHPVQYAFVGIAMAVFYLLLLSLSEHMTFNTAYFISSASCAGILGVYISGVLGQVKHGLFFSGGVIVLYSILFGLLAAEDFALLMGSIFVFLVLAIVMVVTRKVNWYQLNSKD